MKRLFIAGMLLLPLVLAARADGTEGTPGSHRPAVLVAAAGGGAIDEWFLPEATAVRTPSAQGSAATHPHAAPAPVSATPSEERGATLSVGELRLAMDPPEAEILFRKPPEDRSSFPATVLEGGRRLEGKVQVRGSFSRNFLKKSLIVSLPPGSEWQGHRRLSLTALATDPARMRDWLAWRLIHHLGMAAPEVRYIDLFINDEYIGLYLFIEWIDEKVFRRHGLGDDGEFYQPNDRTYCGDFTPAQLPRFDDCWDKLSPRDGDLTRLRALNQEILDTPVERFDEFVDARFNAQSLIDWLVVLTLTSSGDTLNKNYFLHWSRRLDRWTAIAWDFDQSFGRVGDEGAPYPLSIWNDNFAYYYPPELGAPNPLKEKALKNPRLFARYKARIAELLAPGSCKAPHGCKADAATGWFHPLRFGPLVEAVATVVQPRPEKFPSVEGERFALQADAIRVFDEWRFQYLHRLILERTVFDTPLWLPYAAFAPLNPPSEGAPPVRRKYPLTMVATREQPGGGRAFYLDTWLARPLAAITTTGAAPPLRLTVEIEAEQPPAALPPDIPVGNCLERTWFLSVKSAGRSTTARVELDWIQEATTHHELGEGVTDESRLVLWASAGTRWIALPTRVNPIANLLVAEGVPLDSARPLRLVACVPLP